jgi:hypothetical protein
VGISKKTWSLAYFCLADNDLIVHAFSKLGELKMDEDQLPPEVYLLEAFVCRVYSAGQSSVSSLAELRWQLYKKRNLEAENLPPTRAILVPHIMRTNYTSMRDKAYITQHPLLPPLEESGWMKQDGDSDSTYKPITCTALPAPESVLHFVKCGCKTGCQGKSSCSCAKNRLKCTALCKCEGCSNSVVESYRVVEEEDLNI